ncbi:MAG: hypothetical protein KIG65_07025 [Eubacteriales bacterium]|nr:hypothetical protein [Eubacteriales bacterium]
MYKKIILLLTIIVVGVMMIISMLNDEIENRLPSEDKNTQSLPRQVNSTVTSEEETFLLIAEDDYLNLYNTDRNGPLRISEKIDFKIFPADDVYELRKGITFASEIEAYKMMENFIN